MKPAKRTLRQNVLSKMFDYLQTQYSIEYPREVFVKGSLTYSELKALLSYKSDPQLDDYCRALTQIEDGTYGVCISCKRLIASEALDADPVRRTCTSCESHINDSFLRRHSSPFAPLSIRDSMAVTI